MARKRVSLTETERSYLELFCIREANRVNKSSEGAVFALEGLDKLIKKLEKLKA